MSQAQCGCFLLPSSPAKTVLGFSHKATKSQGEALEFRGLTAAQKSRDKGARRQ